MNTQRNLFSEPASAIETLASRVRAHVQIARPDHWIKNVFVLPGIVIPLSVMPELLGVELIPNLLLGTAATLLVTSSNYVLNELVDAPHDRFHPLKHVRAAAQGRVHVTLGYVQWLAMMALGVWLGSFVSTAFTITLAVLWIMGVAYNVRPMRTKDVAYLDVLTESVNNPLRLLLGWFMIPSGLITPVSLLLSYWMVGSYFMALKRFSEYRTIGDHEVAVAYRNSFRAYTEKSLLVSIMFYAAAGMLFFGAFAIRYRMELVLSFPFVAAVIGVYLWLALQDDSPVQMPERLHQQPQLLLSVSCCAVVMTVLMFWDIPAMYEMFSSTLPSAD